MSPQTWHPVSSNPENSFCDNQRQISAQLDDLHFKYSQPVSPDSLPEPAFGHTAGPDTGQRRRGPLPGPTESGGCRRCPDIPCGRTNGVPPGPIFFTPVADDILLIRQWAKNGSLPVRAPVMLAAKLSPLMQNHPQVYAFSLWRHGRLAFMLVRDGEALLLGAIEKRTDLSAWVWPMTAR